MATDKGLDGALIERACPECGAKLVIRTNRHTEQQFLGCVRYPTCRHTEGLPEYYRLKAAGAAVLPGFELGGEI